MTTEERERRVENSFNTLVGILRHTPYIKNYSEAMKLATTIINNGYLLEYTSAWEYDDYSDCIVCNTCYEKALTNPNMPDEVMLTDFCPHCGAKMNLEKLV